MNIKKKVGAKILTIDDPSIYSSNEENIFDHVEIYYNLDDIGHDSKVLYLFYIENNKYIPYVRRENDELQILPNPFSKGATLPYPELNGNKELYQLNANLIAIDNHLYALQKELSYWNLYKIVVAVEDTVELAVQLELLAPCEGLIINFDQIFTYEGRMYKKGDMVVKTANGQLVFIEASFSGFYYPYLITTSGNQYNISYKYTSNAIPLEGSAEITSSPLGEPHEIETFSIQTSGAVNSFIYGKRVDLENSSMPYSFNIEYKNANLDSIVPPILKFFTSEGEELDINFNCVASGSQWYVTLSEEKPDVLKYMYIK